MLQEFKGVAKGKKDHFVVDRHKWNPEVLTRNGLTFLLFIVREIKTEKKLKGLNNALSIGAVYH